MTKSHTIGAICGAEQCYTSGAHEFTAGILWDSCCSIVSFSCNVL